MIHRLKYRHSSQNRNSQTNAKSFPSGIYPRITLRLPHRNDAKIAKICNLWASHYSANKPSFQNPEKGALGKKAFCRILKDDLLAEGSVTVSIRKCL